MRKVILLTLLLIQTTFAGIWVTPPYPGSNESDSVVVSFCVFDTTLYPVLTDADSITALRFGPDNTLIDSLDQTSGQLHHPRTGWYEIHYRAANSVGDQGIYRVFVRAHVGGDWRGAAVVSYEVMEQGIDPYFAQVISMMPQLGGGAYPCTLYAVDQATETLVADAQLTLYNSDQSALIASGRTGLDGRIIFALDAATYKTYGRALNYLAADTPLEVTLTTGGANDTLWLQPFDPGEPVAGDLCRVYGYIHDLHGKPIPEVTVTAAIDAKSVTSNGAVISPFIESTFTDTLGYWFLDLIPNPLLEPDTTRYDFSIYYPSGTILRRAVVIPDSASFWLK